jgi:hypothetical protein
MAVVTGQARRRLTQMPSRSLQTCLRRTTHGASRSPSTGISPEPKRSSGTRTSAGRTGPIRSRRGAMCW